MQFDSNSDQRNLNNGLRGDGHSEYYWIAGVALLPLLLFFPHWFRSMAVGDNFIALVPVYRWAFDSIRSLHYPLWNPYLFSGFPVSAYPGASPYEILSWVHLFLPTVPATNLHIIITYSVGSVGFYFFGRSMGLGKLGAFTSGAFFSVAGYVLTSFPFILAYGGLAWAGWVLASLEKLRISRGVRDRTKWTLLFGLVATIQFLSGHPHIFMHTCIFAGIYTLIVGIGREKGKQRWIWFACAAVGILLVPLLGALFFLPGHELQQLSWRQTMTFDYFVGHSYTLSELIRSTIFIKGIFFSGHNSFLGAVPFLMICYGAAKGYRDIRYKALIFIAIFSAIIILGQTTPVPRLLYHVPFLNIISGSVRFGVTFTFACAILAGYGMEHLITEGKWDALKWISAFIVIVSVGSVLIIINLSNPLLNIPSSLAASVLMLFFIHRRIKTRKNIWLALALVAFLIEPKIYIWSMLRNEKNLIDPSARSPIVDYVSTDNEGPGPPPRILTVVDVGKHDSVFLHNIGAQNISLLQGIHNATGYLPMFTDRYGRILNLDYTGFPDYLKNTIAESSAVLDILNIKHIIIPKKYLAGDLTYRLSTFPDATIVKGIRFREEVYVELMPGEEITFRTPDMETQGVAIVSALGDAALIPQGAEVLKVVLASEKGATREVVLKAGVDTAVGAHEILSAPPKLEFTIDTIPFYKPMELILYPNNNRIFPIPDFKTKRLGMISHMFNARHVPQGAEVARITVRPKEGPDLELPVRAGIESSDMSIGYSSEEVPHQKARVASSFKLNDDMTGLTFFAHWDLDRVMEVREVEVRVLSKSYPASIYVSHITLSGPTGESTPVFPIHKPKHDIAPIFPVKYDKPAPGPRHHLYYSINYLDRPVRVKRCTLKNLMKSGNISIRAITLFRDARKLDEKSDFTGDLIDSVESILPAHIKDNLSSTLPGDHAFVSKSLTYIDHTLGDLRLYDMEETADAYIWHKKSTMPRAWLAGSAIWLAPDEMLETIKTGKFADGNAFDPRHTALVDKGRPVSLLPGGRVRGQVLFEHYSPDEVRLQVIGDRRCMLVLSEAFYPGWNAWVDGKPTEVYRTDYVLRGVFVNAGKHEVVFRFQPKSVRNGRIISFSTLAFIAVVWLAVRLRFPNSTDAT